MLPTSLSLIWARPHSDTGEINDHHRESFLDEQYIHTYTFSSIKETELSSCSWRSQFMASYTKWEFREVQRKKNVATSECSI